MADLSFYEKTFGSTTQERAFENFLATLQNYYDATFYVDWSKVLRLKERFEHEYALLGTLCKKKNRKQAAYKLLVKYPEVIRALPTLIACRGTVSLVGDAAEAIVENYDFLPKPDDPEGTAARYATFIEKAGLIRLLDQIDSVADYMMGVEVGLDSNARKNRGGKCGIQALSPAIARSQNAISDLNVKPEANYRYLAERGFELPPDFSGITWDFAFWKESKPGRFVVMEVNHYGSCGSKPSAIAREYEARAQALKNTRCGFIWVTDGLGWKQMANPLRNAFNTIDHMMNIRLATEGQLEYVLNQLLV